MNHNNVDARDIFRAVQSNQYAIIISGMIEQNAIFDMIKLTNK